MPHNVLPLIEEMTEASVGYHKLADGKRMRYALLWPTGVTRGTVLVGLGRREFIEKKFTEVGKDFRQRGFRVIIFEWRGQGLSDRFLDPSKHQRDYIVDFATHLEDLRHFHEAIVKPNLNGPLFLCGHSMGSHLLLRWVIEQQDIKPAGIILTAPMLALAGHLVHASASLVSWSALKLGYGDEYAVAQHDYSEQDRVFTGNPLSHDPMRFSLMEKYFASHPKLTVGGITWQWLHAGVKSMQITQRRAHLENLRVPLLAITGTQDRVTPLNEIERFIKMIPQAKSCSLSGARHDVMNEIEDYRSVAWRWIDDFIAPLLKVS